MPFSEWRKIPIKVIRPENEIVLDLLHFTPSEIAEIIERGRNIARKTLGTDPSHRAKTNLETEEAEIAQ